MARYIGFSSAGEVRICQSGWPVKLLNGIATVPLERLECQDKRARAGTKLEG
jgi:hypothetical protein